MSRSVTRHRRAIKQPQLSITSRQSRTKDQKEKQLQTPTTKKRNAGLKIRGKAIRRMNTRRRDPSPVSEESSTAGGSETGDEASDEESESETEEEEDEPPVVAPSRSKGRMQMGRNKKKTTVDQVSVVSDGTSSMFGDYDEYYGDDDDPRLSPEENRKRFEDKIFAESSDEDEDFYQAVDDISESEEEEIEQQEEQHIAREFSEQESNDPDFYTNQIDGLSAYGFGDDSDGSIPFLSSPDSDAEFIPTKHVHFHVDEIPNFPSLANSPTITRPLLPSALPNSNNGNPHPAESIQSHPDRSSVTILEDPDDSDLTDDCLPEQAHHSTPNVLQRQVRESTKSPPPSSPQSPKKEFKTPARRRGPPRGIFIDEGDKTSGILDSSGKVILMTNPHLLGEEFARRYGASQTSSPDAGFEELLDETDLSDSPPDSQAPMTMMMMPSADMLMPNFPNPLLDPAFQPQSDGIADTLLVNGNVSNEGFGAGEGQFTFDLADFGEIPDGDMALEDVIRWSDDDSEDEGLTSPIFMPPSRELSNLSNTNNEFAHLMNNGNVTAFRRNADPNFAAFNNTPPYDFGILNTPPPRRKRKTYDSPYTSSHYKGVTPVQRIRDPNQDYPLSATSTSQRSSKRRKITM